jgi:hypothetical protein
MAIVKRPNRSPSDSDKADRFIAGQGAPKNAAPKGKRVPVIVRFEPSLLAKIDAAAEKLDLGRASWLRLVASKALEGEGS